LWPFVVGGTFRNERRVLRAPTFRRADSLRPPRRFAASNARFFGRKVAEGHDDDEVALCP
jgi:hypothetical protein